MYTVNFRMKDNSKEHTAHTEKQLALLMQTYTGVKTVYVYWKDNLSPCLIVKAAVNGFIVEIGTKMFVAHTLSEVGGIIAESTI